jgi:hypothetical protein
MNQSIRTKQRKQQQQQQQHNLNQYTSGNGSNSSSGVSRSQQQPQSCIAKITSHLITVRDIVTKTIGWQPMAQNHNRHLLVRLGCFCGALLAIYVLLSSLLFLLHSNDRNNSTLISHQEEQATTPFYLTNAEEEIVSKILGIDPKASYTRKSTQCTSSAINIRIPPTTLRKGKSQFLTEVEYQNQAVQQVHNIRVLLGMATQLGIRQSMMMNQPIDDTPTAMENMTENTASDTARTLTLPFQLLTQPSPNQLYKSLDDAVIMDYGCGPGRLLIGLLSANVCFNKYIGVDVNSKDIQWLTETYIHHHRGVNPPNRKNKNDSQKLLLTGTQKLQMRKQRNQSRRNLNQNGIYQEFDEDRFQFLRVNVKNERYNKNGVALDTDSPKKTDRIVFPTIEMHEALVNTVDIMIIRSVFSHMLASDIYHHLRSLYPIVKANTGIMIVSLFLNPIPESPVETVITKEAQSRGNHLVYISKQVFETMVYETGYSIVLYMSRWNMGEDVYVLSSNGNKSPLPLLEDNEDFKEDVVDQEDQGN